MDDRAVSSGPTRSDEVTAGGGDAGDARGPHGDDQDEALARLEDVLHLLPFDRAVPDLAHLLEAAGVEEDLLRRDERARKVLYEALLARPFGTFGAVQQVRTEVELLTLEVEVLTDRLQDPALDREVFERTAARLAQVRARLEEISEQL